MLARKEVYVLRKLKIIVSILGVFVSVCFVSGIGLSASPALAGDNQGVFICILPGGMADASCADLKGDQFTDNNTIWMWDYRTGGGLGWLLQKVGTVGADGPFISGSGLNTRYQGDPIYNIEKTTATGHDGCMSSNGINVEWEPCDSTIVNGTLSNGTLWVLSASSFLVNIAESNNDAMGSGFCSPYCANVLGASSLANGTYLDGGELGLTGDYEQWYIGPL
jgi:hypothetical protein